MIQIYVFEPIRQMNGELVVRINVAGDLPTGHMVSAQFEGRGDEVRATARAFVHFKRECYGNSVQVCGHYDKL